LIDDPILFEKIVAHLLKAKHNERIDCGTSRKRQFDGYIELWLESLVKIRVGIECKKEKRGVEIGEVEAFRTKITDCHLERGIIVSFHGYQTDAIESAKRTNLSLLEFRPLNSEEIYGPLEENDFERIGEFEWNAVLQYEEPSLQDRWPNIYEVMIFDKSNHLIGILGEIVESILQNIKTEQSGEYTIDWSDLQVFAQWDSNGMKITRIVRSVEIKYNLEKEEIRLKSLSNPSNWYILEDVIENRRQIKSLEEIEEIKKLYL